MMNNIKNRINRLEPKDQRAILVLAVFLGLVLLIWGVILPAHNYYQSSKQAMIDNKELSHWVALNAHKVKPREESGEKPEGSLLEWVTATATKNDLSISRFQPEGESNVRIWLNEVDYEKVNTLLQQLMSDFDIRIDSLIIDRTATPGLVNVQCTLG